MKHYGDFEVTGVASTFGPGPLPTKIEGSGTSGVFTTNHPWGPGDAAKSSWMVQLDANGNQFNVIHRAPSAGVGIVTYPLYVTTDDKTHCTLALNQNSVLLPVVSTTVYNAWIAIVNLSLTTRGGSVLLNIMSGVQYNSLNTTQVNIHQAVFRDGTQIGGYQPIAVMGAVGTTPLPTFVMWDIAPPAGAHTYTYYIYQMSGATSSLTGPGGGNSHFQAVEMAG